MKILISCYACSPYRGSEPGMGWNFISGLAKKGHELYVITEKEKWESDITNYMKEHLSEYSNVHFYFIKKKRARLLRKIWPPSYYWFYKAWQKKAFQLARTLNNEIDFDIIHQLNMVGYREPGYLWKINKPFIWGPIGGMNFSPINMLSAFDIRSILFLGGRNIVNWIQMNYYQRPKKAAKKACYVLAATSETAKTAQVLWNIKPIVIPEVGTHINKSPNKEQKETDKVDICWAGQLIVRKALDILLYAIAAMKYKSKIHLKVLGDGPCKRKYFNITKQNGLDHIVDFYGNVPLNDAHRIISESDLFCITSLSDLTSTVLLESLSAGVPVIAPEHCGFKDVITPECGFLIKVSNRKKYIMDLAQRLDEIAMNKQILSPMKEMAIKRAETYSWDKKIEKLNNLYLLSLKKVNCLYQMNNYKG